MPDSSSAAKPSWDEWVDAERHREVEIVPGDDQDVCPLCGIWRMNAGWITATCGTYFGKPGCFAAPEEAKSRV